MEKRVKKGMNKKAITHIEAILSILIFISGIVIVVMLARPMFMSSGSGEAEINALEQEFKEFCKSDYDIVFYTRTDMGCYNDMNNIIVEEELPYYKVYTKQEKMQDIISQCEFNENEYTFPMKIDIYDQEKIDNFESEKDFNITINEKTLGKTPPQNFPIKAKEIEIKLLKNNKITIENVILHVW